jgi:hypothetical protein
MGLRQIRRSPAQHFVLLLEQTIPAPQFPQLVGFATTDSGLFPFVDICLPHPLRQRHRMDPEIRGDLIQPHSILAAAGDPDHIVTELLGVGLGHDDILPGSLSASQIDVTYPCSSPYCFVDR